MKNKTIYVTNFDKKRLKNVLPKTTGLSRDDAALLKQLENKIDTASIITQKAAPPYLVTMNCQVRVTDLDENQDMDFWLVYPNEASSENDKLSVISDIGVAILGLKVGDEVDYLDKTQKKNLRIARIYYQPEDNQHYKL